MELFLVGQMVPEKLLLCNFVWYAVAEKLLFVDKSYNVIVALAPVALGLGSLMMTVGVEV